VDVLLSIRPEHADAILNGTKRYEFRRVLFSRSDVCTIYLYASSAVRKIVGCFDIGVVLRGRPEVVWERCREYAGISMGDFFRYFAGSSQACAIGVKNPRRFPQPVDPRTVVKNFTPPQSFRYVPSNWLDRFRQGSWRPC